MAPLLLLVAVWVAAVVVAHYSVVLVERNKASWWKAAALAVSFSILGSMAARYGPDAPPLLRWLLYFAVVSILVWTLFRLKPLNNLAVAACYLGGSQLITSIGIRIGASGSEACERINSIWC